MKIVLSEKVAWTEMFLQPMTIVEQGEECVAFTRSESSVINFGWMISFVTDNFPV